jgi:ankyrin repeat protein
VTRVVGALVAAVLLSGAVVPVEPLLDAVRAGDVASVRALLETGADPDVAQGDGLSALHLAARAGDIEIVQLLLGAGAEVAAKTRIGE